MGQNGNGYRGPFPAGLPGGVPIVGQPFELKTWLVTLVGKCQCGEPVLIAGQVGANGQCPSCRRIVIVRGFRSSGQRVDWDLAIGTMPAAPPAGTEDAPAG